VGLEGRGGLAVAQGGDWLTPNHKVAGSIPAIVACGSVLEQGTEPPGASQQLTAPEEPIMGQMQTI